MKIIGNTIIPFLLVLSLTACNSAALTPAISQTDIIGTVEPTAETEAVMTLVAIPTATLITPTAIPPGIHSNNYAPPPGKLDYAKKTLRKHHALLPYISDAKGVYGLEYYGCAETDDFGGSITYDLMLPIETVDSAFVKFYKEDHWEFVEPIHGLEMGVPSIKYEVYRISTEDKPAFERLEVVLYDYTRFNENGERQTRVRSNLVHVEDRKYFNYVFDFVDYPCRIWYAFNTGW